MFFWTLALRAGQLSTDSVESLCVSALLCRKEGRLWKRRFRWKNCAERSSFLNFWKRDISSALEKAFPGVFGDLGGCWTPSKRGVFVHARIHSLFVNGIVTASSHALTCPFKQSNLSAWSLLNSHPTHAYLSWRLCFIQVVCSPMSWSGRVIQIMPTEVLLLNASLETFSPSTNW